MVSKGHSQAPLGPEGGPSPSPQAIREQLEKVLLSQPLVNSPNLRAFLRFIVEKTLAGEAPDIKGYTVATQVLGRKPDFDPSLDPIVRIMAGRLRRALQEYYQGPGEVDPVVIEVPRGSYVPEFRQSAPSEAGRPALGETLPEPLLTLPRGPAVAVMPLLNLTGDRRQEYFTEGLAEELTSELARYQELRVIAYQSARRWLGRSRDPREVGRDLGVRFVLEGSIRKDASTVKIDLHLVDTQSGQQIWGERYCRELRADRLIALQEEIARQVAARIGSHYGVIPQTLSRESRRKPPETLETYEAFLRFSHHIMVLSQETFGKTLKVLEDAVTREPESGLTWASLSFLYGQSYSLQLLPLDRPLERAVAAAQKAVALEPENQLARAALAHGYFFNNQLDMMRQEADLALALNPNAPAPIGFLGWLLALSGDWERGLAILRKGIELNPYYPGWFHMAPCFSFFQQGRYEEAHQEALAFNMPQLFWDPLLRAATLGLLGKEAAAAQALAELLALKPDFPSEGRFLIACFAKAPALVNDLLKGLARAGLGTQVHK